jgi:hypothetical protein
LKKPLGPPMPWITSLKLASSNLGSRSTMDICCVGVSMSKVQRHEPRLSSWGPPRHPPDLLYEPVAQAQIDKRSGGLEWAQHGV